MYRLTKMGKWFAVKIDSVEDDLENISIFVSEGTLVILTDDLEDAAVALDIDLRDIIV